MQIYSQFCAILHFMQFCVLLSIAVAASALLLIAVYPVIQLVKSSSDQTLTSISDSTPIYSQTSSVSDDWSDFADADIFMDNMNW